MAGASTYVRGVTIKLSADANGFINTLNKTKSELNQTQRVLNDVTKLLKFDPKNTELLAQKQRDLQEQLKIVHTRMNAVNSEIAEIKNAPSMVNNYQQSIDALNRELISLTNQEKKLNDELKAVKTQPAWLTEFNAMAPSFTSNSNKIKNQIEVLKNKLSALSEIEKKAAKYMANHPQKYKEQYKILIEEIEETKKKVDELEKQADPSKKTWIDRLSDATKNLQLDTTTLKEKHKQLSEQYQELLAIQEKAMREGENSAENYAESMDKLNEALDEVGKGLHEVDIKIDPNKRTWAEKFKDAMGGNKTALQELRDKITEANEKMDKLRQLEADAGDGEELAKVQEAIKELKKQTKELNDELDSHKPINQLGKKFGEVGDKIMDAGQKLQGFSRLAKGVLTGSIGSYSSFEDAFVGVTKTVDATEEEYELLKDEIRTMATETASSAEDIAGVMEVAGQLGISGVENLTTFTKTMVMLGDSTNVSAAEAAEELAKFSNITQLSAKDSDKLGSAVVDLGNNFATNESNIIMMATRLASAGTVAGLSAQDILGLATAMSSAGIKAEAGGSSMTQVLNNITKAVAKGGKEEERFNDLVWQTTALEMNMGDEAVDIQDGLAGMLELIRQGADDTEVANYAMEQFAVGAKDANKVLELTKEYASDVYKLEEIAKIAGVSAEEFANAWKNEPIEAVQLFIKGLGELDEEDTTVVETLEKLGMSGIRQSNTLRALALSADNMSAAVDTANSAYEDNTALVTEANKRYGTLTSKTHQAQARIKQMAASMGEKLIPVIEKILGVADNLLDAWNGLDDGTQTLIAGILAISSVASPALKGLGGAIKGIGMIIGGGLPAAIAIGVAAFAGLMYAGIATTDNGLAPLRDKMAEIKDEADDMSKEIYEASKEFENLDKIADENALLSDSQFQKLSDYKDRLVEITDETGKIKDGYRDEAEVIVNELNNALGLELDIQGNVIQGYNDIIDTIDTMIAKKKIAAYADIYQGEYEEAIKNQSKVSGDIMDANKQWAEANELVNRAADSYGVAVQNASLLREEMDKLVASGARPSLSKAKALDKAERLVESRKKELDSFIEKRDEVANNIKKLEKLQSEYNATITNYNNLNSASYSNSIDKMNNAMLRMKYGLKDSTNATEQELTEQRDEFKNRYKEMKEAVEKGMAGASKTQLEELRQMYNDAERELKKIQGLYSQYPYVSPNATGGVKKPVVNSAGARAAEAAALMASGGSVTTNNRSVTNNNGGNTVNINVNGGQNAEAVAEEVLWRINEEIRIAERW